MKKSLLYLIALLFLAFNIKAQTISIIGSTGPASSWSIDTDMITTDNTTYVLNNVVLTSATDPNTTGIKFRLNNDWTTNWGNANWPSGTGTQNGANIQTVAGTYDITFNRLNGTYTFIQSTGLNFSSIGIWGPAVNSQQGYNAPDVDMTTTDGIFYTLSGFNYSSGNAYFRENNGTNFVWGSTIFPTGTAVQGGPTIPVNGGEWFVTFNKNTGSYSFEYPSIGVLGTALNGYTNPDTNLTTSDGFNYTISNLTLTDGTVKFRKDDLWTSNWGSTGFPTGTGTQDGAEIPVSQGTYNITFERSSGDYSFLNSLTNSENTISNLKTYPNPTNDFWYINHSGILNNIELIDSFGKIIKSYKPNTNQFQIDATNLSQGIYFVKITSGLDFTVKKIIKN